MIKIIRLLKSKIRLLYDKYDTKDIQFVTGIFSVLSTLVMTYLTIIMSIANARMAEANDRMAESNDRMSVSGDHSFVLARYQHTFALCQRFNESYEDSGNIDRLEYKMWEENNLDYSLNINEAVYEKSLKIKDRWAVADSARLEEYVQKRIGYLMDNSFFQQMLSYFEEAKILHKKQLLDVDAFENDFVGILFRLSTTQYPTIDQYIQYVRSLSKRINKNTIWDGYYYCLNNIITRNYMLPRAGKICKVYVSSEDKVKTGDIILSYRPIGSDKEELIICGQNGVIVDLFVKEDEEYNAETIAFRVSQRDYYTEQ